MTLSSGTHDGRFDAVRAAFENNLATGEELGASLVVDIDGESVVDIWGGYRDAARTAGWERDTIVNVWSTTKTVTSLATLMLIDRGQLDAHAPVARYWPEFAARGKDAIEVRHLLSHTSGLSGLEPPVKLTDLYDPADSTALFAGQEPWWEPGTASGYHAATYGHLLGELVRRVTGSTLREFVANELSGPLAADFHLGAAEVDWPRVAEIVPPPPPSRLPEPGSIAARTFAGPVVSAGAANTADWRRAEIGALNGHGNARSVARLLSVIARGGSVDGTRYLGEATLDLIFEDQADGVDLVLGIPIRWGTGFALPKEETLSWIPAGRICFWGGWGGSMIIMDLERRLTISYAMNRMAPGIIGSDRSEAYVSAVYDALA
ncbi:serine hydrolase domain-containing protein [Lentzea sp. NPDC102401]|uniref:serine hydrolase domain-containing protein n=1 Tax=Lentzea sp. NPDC102401 TaxID=3364128 RepID=UPI0038142002